MRADPLSPRRGEYQFNQALLQTVAYDTLSKPERRQLHAAAAEHLRTALPDEGDEVVDVVATHYLAAMRAGPPDDAEGERLRGLAFDAYQRAADRAERLGSHGDGADGARACSRTHDLRRRRGRALGAGSRMAWAGLETTETRSPPGGRIRRALRRRRRAQRTPAARDPRADASRTA